MVDKSGKPPETAGVLGDGALHPGKYNMALMRRAIKGKWPITREIRQKVIDQMVLVVDCAESDRDKIGAAKVIVSADGMNAKREATATPQQHEHHHSGAVVHATVRGELMNDPAYLEYLRNHQGDGDTGSICESSGPTLEAGSTPEVSRQGTSGHLNGNGRH